MKKLKEKLNAKLSKNGGFTLVEMLIVVAIIAILVMVSFPLISANLDQAREGVDEANERSAMSMAEAYYLTHQDEVKALAAGKDLEAYYYINKSTHEGKIATKAADVGTDFKFDYGVSTKARGIGVTQAEPKGAGVKVSISAAGVITKVEWTKTGLS